MTRSSAGRVHEVLGRRVRCHDSLGTFRRVLRALTDGELDGRERFSVLVRLVWANPGAVAEAFGADTQRALSETLWECFGIDIDGNREHSDKRAFDLDEDEARIAVTVREAYGLDLEALDRVPYKEACSLIVMAPRDTPMGQAVYYRLGKPPKRTKWNQDEVKAWHDARDYYRLRGTKADADPTERANAEASSAFEAMKRRAMAAQRREGGNG